PPDLSAVAAEPCTNRDKLNQETKWIRWTGQDQYEALLEHALSRPRPREWVSSFRPVAIEAPGSAAQLQADLDIEYAGLQWGKVVVRVMMVVAPDSLPAGLPSATGPEFSISGQVLRGGEPFETFLYKLHSRPTGGGVPLVFERYLEPGKYLLQVRLEHIESGSVLVAERELEVPQMQRTSVEQAPASPAPAAV